MPKTVLVADDNPAILIGLSRMFGPERDYEICGQATNGEEAIALAIKHKPDLIIIDFSMPLMNGVEAARKLRQIMPEIPIILFTVHAETLTKAPTDLPVSMVVSKNDSKLMSYVRRLIPAENPLI